MQKYKDILPDDLLGLIHTDHIKAYLIGNGYPFIFTDDEMYEHEDEIRKNEITLTGCSDWQFEQEAEQRNYYFPDYQTEADKIVELIRQGKDWQKEAMEYFGEITGKIL